MDTQISTQLTESQKQEIYSAAAAHVSELAKELQYQADKLIERGQEYRQNLKEFADIEIDDAASDSAEKELAIAKVRLLEGMAKDLILIKDSPYFVRLDVTWPENGESETLYIGKGLYKDQNIFSWVSPISTLRYSEVGSAAYTKPDGSQRYTELKRKDNFLITKSEIVFMTHQDQVYPRQMVFQKHMNQRKEFLLPEIVAELDRIQDQIIRSEPEGYFLISGPAGSGKTTLALHRVAYLVLTPEFKDYFAPDKIIVFVSNQGDIDYFSQLLPELGIEGVRITTFSDWACLVVNSRYTVKTVDRFKPLPKSAALEFIREQNLFPELPPEVVIDEIRKFKQQLVHKLTLVEKKPKLVYPTLHQWYTDGLTGMDQRFVSAFKSYLKFQQTNRYLDDPDLVILIESLEYPPKQYSHVVIDEVQNWTPHQLSIVTALATRTHKSISFIGDIRQKTKAFSIKEWAEISPEFEQSGPRNVELLKVYRNSLPILQHLHQKGYEVNLDSPRTNGKVVEQEFSNLDELQERVKQLISDLGTQIQVGVISRYRSSIERLEYLGHGDTQLHILTVDQAQGLEFDAVIMVDAQDFERSFDNVGTTISESSKIEYAQQGKHLYYVAATRAKSQLYILKRING